MENLAVGKAIASQTRPITAKVPGSDDGRSSLRLLSRYFVHRMKPRPVIYKDGHIRMSLSNDNDITIDDGVVVPVEAEGVLEVIKAWLVDI